MAVGSSHESLGGERAVKASESDRGTSDRGTSAFERGISRDLFRMQIRDTPEGRESLTPALDFEPSQETLLYTLLPTTADFMLRPNEVLLLDLLTATSTATEFDDAASAIYLQIESGERQVRARRGGFWDVYRMARSRFDARAGIAPSESRWRPRYPFAGITRADVRDCLVASALLLLRTGEFLPPATVMAIWVREGKFVRNKYYHPGYAEFTLLDEPNARVSMLALLRRLLSWAIEREQVPPDIREEIERAYPEDLRGPPLFEHVTNVLNASHWWAVSQALPHLWSLDSAVLRYPQRASGIPLPPLENGRNIAAYFTTWLGALRDVGAFRTKEDLESITHFCSSDDGAYRVGADQSRGEWPLRINGAEARRTIPLFLYILGAYYLSRRRAVADRIGAGDATTVPDSAAYAAFNGGVERSVRGRISNTPEGLQRKFERKLTEVERAAVLDPQQDAMLQAQERYDQLNFVNVFRFMFGLEILRPLMRLPSRQRL